MKPVLDGLQKEHPRLLCTDERLANIRQLIADDQRVEELWHDVQQQAEEILEQGPIEYILEGPRLLTQSRICLHRIYRLALAYRLTGDQRFLQRGFAEMQAAASFPDWNPSHFLDTAEMTHALAIGYDWFYADLTDEQREEIRQAIIRLGLEPGRRIYAGEAKDPLVEWTECDHNWNQVCNGGMVIGALAIAEDEPQLASFILENALQALPKAMKSFAPDGGWNEGPGYWGYTVNYTVTLMACLETALGTDFGLSESQGFAQTGMFCLHFTGPLGLTFNYADAGNRLGSMPALFWLARRFDQPALAWHQLRLLKTGSPLDLIWFDPRGYQVNPADIPKDGIYQGIDVGLFHSNYDNDQAIFVGFKGGDNQANHSHLDLGSFVLDALGQRWAVDLGSDDYNLPGYFNVKRWEYFRLNTTSHNTLLINGEIQDPLAKAPLVGSHSSEDLAFAIVDLSQAYAGVTQLKRGVALVQRELVVVHDEFEVNQATDILWSLLTFADIELKGTTAILRQGGQVLYAHLLAPASAAFGIADANPAPPQGQQPGAKRLVVELGNQQDAASITVVLSPGKPGLVKQVAPLEQWQNKQQVVESE